MTTARTLRFLWAAICSGGALVLAVFGGLVVSGSGGSLGEHGEAAFYTVALVGLVGLIGAFALLRRMEGRLLQAGSDAEAESVVQSYGVAALAAVEGVAVAGDRAVEGRLGGALLVHVDREREVEARPRGDLR